jgi:uncharacterized repeat protein (TIGR02059 family)
MFVTPFMQHTKLICQLKKKLFVLLLLPAWISLQANTYYISPSGNDIYPGSISQPFYTLTKAFSVASAGDVIYMRGGTYHFSSRQELISKSCSSDNPLNILNYPGETPEFDFVNSSLTIGIIMRDVDYIHVKGIRVTNISQPDNTHVGLYGLILADNVTNCTIEMVEVDHIEGTGVAIAGNTHDDLFLNCDSHHNADPNPGGEGVPYGGSDGFWSASTSATNITFRGCRAWFNSDDGWDLRLANGEYVIDNCWAFWNGFIPDSWDDGGNGDGYKLGGKTSPGTNDILRKLTNSIAFKNRGTGISPEPDNQDMILGVEMYNCTAYDNAVSWGNGINTGAYNNYTIIKNCIDYNNNGKTAWVWASAEHSHNSFDLSVTVSDADFLSLNSDGMDGSRQSDGSLPYLNFLRLAKGSDLIDAGEDVGLSYGGNNPDLGAFELADDLPPVPIFTSATVADATPTVVEINFDLNLNSQSVPSTSAFTVKVNSVSKTINNVSISGTKVKLTLAEAIVYSNAVNVSYTDGSDNPLSGTAGGVILSFDSKSVTNNVKALIPVYVSSAVENATPSQIDIVYNLTLANKIPSISAFSILVNSTARTITTVTVSGTTVRLTLSSPIVYGDIVLLNYTKPSTNQIQTAAGGLADNLVSKTVTNRCINPAYVSSAIENATPNQIDIVYNLALANKVPATTAFSVLVNSIARPVSSVVVSGTVVHLTLSAAVVYGDVVLFSYTKPSTNQLQTAAAGIADNLVSKSVTNKCINPGISPVFVSASIENATPSQVDIVYSMSLANKTPATSAFSVLVNSTARTISAVSVSGTLVHLTLSTPVTYGDIVLLSYTKPSSNQLQTATGGFADNLASKSVTNKCINTVVVGQQQIVINYPKNVYSGFVNEIEASFSNGRSSDSLKFEWSVPSGVPVSTIKSLTTQFLAPWVDANQTVQFRLKVTSGTTVLLNDIPITVLPYKPQLFAARISDILASDYQSPNIPSNILDGNITSKWASIGDNKWLTMKLAQPFKISYLQIGFASEQKSESFFDIYASSDNVTWEPILTDVASCRFSGERQVFDFPQLSSTKNYSYIKYVGHGNSTDTWNNISEFKIFGQPQEKLLEYTDRKVTIYPNPAADFINISIEEPTLQVDKVWIIDNSGKIVFEKILNPVTRNLQFPLNLKTGIYLVDLSLKNSIIYSQRLIV